MTRFALAYIYKGVMHHSRPAPFFGTQVGIAYNHIPGLVAWVSVENGWPDA